MIKKALFTLCAAFLALAIVACEQSTPPTSGGSGEPLPEGIEAFKPPEPGSIPTVERPGSSLSKSSGSGE